MSMRPPGEPHSKEDGGGEPTPQEWRRAGRRKRIKARVLEVASDMMEAKAVVVRLS